MAKRNDPKAALRIARRELARPNPSPNIISTPMHVRLAVFDMCREMQNKGINISSLTEEEWLELLKAQGLSPDDAIVAYENVSAWSVTDEV